MVGLKVNNTNKVASDAVVTEAPFSKVQDWDLVSDWEAD